ncbi:MAG TPA: HAD family hydrolase [Candidatus Saccharimonadales bacterium]
MSITIDSRDIEIVSFDMWLTIINTNTIFGSTRKEMIYKKIAAKNGHLNKTAFEKAFEAMKRETELASESSGHHIDLEARINDLLRRLNLASLPKEQLLEIEREQDKLARKYIPPLLSAKTPLLFRNIIESGRRIAIISNTGMLTSDHVRYYLNKHGLDKFISFEVYSDETGYTKPSKHAYDKLLGLTNIKPQHIVHIGDNENADFKGAVDCHFQSCLTQLTDEGVPLINNLLRL